MFQNQRSLRTCLLFLFALGAALPCAGPSTVASAPTKGGSRLADNEAVRRLRARLGSLPTDIQVESGLAYRSAGGRDLRLDIYRPAEKSPATRPAVLYIHGGGWRGGDRRSNRAFFIQLVRQGFIVASADYRLVPAAHFPAPAEDCRAALRFLRAHADKYHIDADHIALAGASAGGHLAALLATAPDDAFRTRDFSDQSNRVSAVVALYGVYDLRELPVTAGTPLVTAFLNGSEAARPDAYRRASPQYWVETQKERPAASPAPAFPPILLLHGTADHLIPIIQAERFDAALRAAGAECELISVRNGGHGLSTGRMSPTPDEFNQRIGEFLGKHLRRTVDGRR